IWLTPLKAVAVAVAVVAAVVVAVAEFPDAVASGTNSGGASCGCPATQSVREATFVSAAKWVARLS
ncbi:MAG TPA: hypothetical protein VJM47_06530, partial [Nitrosospira sp.]|nr:hypothetical protein [Nitrosospira sp.]